jgi:hypothetical protein
MNYKEFCELQKDIYDTAVVKGWWENRNIKDPYIQLQVRLLNASEAFEAFECMRAGQMEVTLRESDGKPEGFPTEIADVVIRLLDSETNPVKNEELFLVLGDPWEPYDNTLDYIRCISNACMNGHNFKALSLCFECANKIGFNLWDVVKQKHEFNKTRPFMHGGKKF